MLSDAIPKVAAMEQEEEHPYYPRPSLASFSSPEDPGRCVRAMTYHRVGVPPAPWPGRFILVLDDSSWHEELTLDWLAKAAIRTHSRQMAIDYVLPAPIGTGGYCLRCRTDIPNTILHGHIDALFTDLAGVDRLLEHKAINRYRFDELLKGELPLDYIIQCCIYLGGLHRIAPDITSGLLLVKCKDTAQYLELLLSYETDSDRCIVHSLIASDGTNRIINRTLDGLVTGALDKFQRVEAAARANALPPRPYQHDTWRCQYCRFGQHCWDGYVGEITESDADVILPNPLGPLLAAYCQANEAKADAEARAKRIKPRILTTLETAHAKSGLVDGYCAMLKIQKRSQLDSALIPADVKLAATKSKEIVILQVSQTRHLPTVPVIRPLAAQEISHGTA